MVRPWNDDSNKANRHVTRILQAVRSSRNNQNG